MTKSFKKRREPRGTAPGGKTNIANIVEQPMVTPPPKATEKLTRGGQSAGKPGQIVTAAVSARAASPTVYASKTYLVNTPGFNFATSNVFIFGGGTLLTGNTNSFVIGKPNKYNHFTVQNINIIRTNGVTVAPNTNCYGIWLATDNPTNQGGYWEGWDIADCKIIGFQSAIVVGGGTHGKIERCETFDCWSNMVTFMGGYASDHCTLELNDFNSLDGGLPGSPLPMSVLQGLSVVEFDGENLGVLFQDNDIAGASQVIKTLPTGNSGIHLRYSQNEVESMYNNNTNKVLIEIWNGSADISGSAQCGYGPAYFGISNYLGYVGFYATNTNVSLRLDKIDRMSPSDTICNVDVWQYGSTNGSGYADGATSPDVDPAGNWTVTTHTNMYDAGVVIPASSHKFSEFLFTNYFDFPASSLPAGLNSVIDIGGSILTLNNASGGSANFGNFVSFANAFSLPNGCVTSLLEDRGGASSMAFYADITHNIILESTNSSHADLQDTNGIIQLNGPVIATNGITLINGSFTGNGSGLTNYSAVNLTTNGANPAPAQGQVLAVQANGGITFTNPASGGSGITALTGDVTASGSGSVVATVVQVGGVTAANVASGATAANAATTADTGSTIVMRNSIGNFSAGTISATFSGSGASLTALNASQVTSGTLPAAQLPAFIGDITTTAGSATTTLKATGTAGTYTKTTFDSNGRETSGTTLSSGDMPSSVPTSVGITGANGITNNLSISGNVLTGTIGQTNLWTLTNLTAAAVWNFAVPETTCRTNANFTLPVPSNVQSVGYNWPVMNITNYSGSLITITLPAGCNLMPTSGAANCTNNTMIIAHCIPGSSTNIWIIPEN